MRKARQEERWTEQEDKKHIEKLLAEDGYELGYADLQLVRADVRVYFAKTKTVNDDEPPVHHTTGKGFYIVLGAGYPGCINTDWYYMENPAEAALMYYYGMGAIISLQVEYERASGS